MPEYCMESCLDASAPIGDWEDGSPPACQPVGVPKMKKEGPDPEYKIYMKYFGDKRAFKSAQGMKSAVKLYREELMGEHIKQRIGVEYVDKYRPILIQGQEELLAGKRKLDFQRYESKSETVTPAMIEDYNMIFNASLDKIRKQLPKDLYEKFFGLAYDQKIDVKMFLTKELADKWGIK